MNAVKQGVIISFFAVLFLLQSVAQLLPMHGSDTQQAVTHTLVQTVELEMNSSATKMLSSHLEASDNKTNANLDAGIMLDMTTFAHGEMSDNCEVHCQGMTQDCAEIMCSSLVYDETIGSPWFTAPMQSVNFYALAGDINITSSSLYRPPIAHLS